MFGAVISQNIKSAVASSKGFPLNTDCVASLLAVRPLFVSVMLARLSDIGYPIASFIASSIVITQILNRVAFQQPGGFIIKPTLKRSVCTSCNTYQLLASLGMN